MREDPFSRLRDRFIPEDGRRVEHVFNAVVCAGRAPPPALGQEAEIPIQPNTMQSKMLVLDDRRQR